MSDTSLYERPGGYSNALSRNLYDRSPARMAMSHLHPPCSISNMPFDILLIIAECLEVDEIQMLGKTCKSLLDFTRSRSIWLKLAANMLDLCQPLPLYGFQRVWELSTPSLSYVVRRGTHLYRSWTECLPNLVTPYNTIEAPQDEEIVWLSPITSKYTLCCTKSGKVLCWDITKGDCVAEWLSGADWEIWKCRVEFDERVVYFAMAKKVESGIGTDCQLMALTFPDEALAFSGKPTFSQLSSFCFPGLVISVYLLEPLRRLLSAYIWIEATNTLGLYVLLDWKIPIYVFFNTGIPCDPVREWSCIGYDPENVVIHAEEENQGFQFFYPYSFLQTYASTTPPTGTRPPLVPPPRTVSHPFIYNAHPFEGYRTQSSHFVRQWWPTLPHAENIRRRSCTIMLLTKRVPDPDIVDGPYDPEEPPPGTHLFTIAQHFFSIPLRTDQLRWWYVREPFEIVCFPHLLPGDVIVGDDPVVEAVPVAQEAGAADAVADNAGAPAEAGGAPAIPQQAAVQFIDDGDGVPIIPLIAVDFGCAVWLEYVHYGLDEKRLRLVTFPAVDVDRAADDFACLSDGGAVRTLDVPREIDLNKVCHIGLDQAQGTIILGLTSGNVHIMRYT